MKEITSQSMGTNSVGLHIAPSKLSPGLYHVLASTGGDDQSLSVSYALLGLFLSQDDNNSQQFKIAFETAPLLRKEDAGGAALKGSWIMNFHPSEDEQEFSATIVTVAYDQRISIWQVKNSIVPSSNPNAIFENAKLISRSGNFDKNDNPTISTSNLPFVRLFSELESMVSSIECQWSIHWLQGAMTHVMEVSSLYIVPENGDGRTDGNKVDVSYSMSIAGQGFQTFFLHKSKE